MFAMIPLYYKWLVRKLIKPTFHMRRYSVRPRGMHLLRDAHTDKLTFHRLDTPENIALSMWAVMMHPTTNRPHMVGVLQDGSWITSPALHTYDPMLGYAQWPGANATFVPTDEFVLSNQEANVIIKTVFYK